MLETSFHGTLGLDLIKSGFDYEPASTANPS